MQPRVAVLVEPGGEDHGRISVSVGLSRLFGRSVLAAQSRLGVKRALPSGAHRGAESLTEALIIHGNVGGCDLFLLPGTHPSCGERLVHLGRAKCASVEVRVRPYQELPGALAREEFSVWLDPHGAFVLPLEARRAFSPKVIPIISTFHHLNFPAMLHSWVLRGLFAGTHCCDSVVCPSVASKRALANIFEQVSSRFNEEFAASAKFQPQMNVIPLCVDVSHFRPHDKHRVRRALGLPIDRKLILYAGRLSVADKGDPAPMILAFRDLIRANPRLRPLLLLAGPERKGEKQTIHRLASTLEIKKYIRVMGPVLSQDMHRVLAAADVFVSPTDTVQENLPLTILEAMASGVPQVAPDWDGCREAVSHGETGFLVPTYWTDCCGHLTTNQSLFGWEFDYLTLSQSTAVDLAGIRRYLELLVSNDELRLEMGRRSRERAEHQYSYAAIIGRYESLWRELLEVARSLRSDRRSQRFNEPTYFDWFAHFASRLLDNRTRIMISPKGVEASRPGRLMLPHEGLIRLNILNARLLEGLLAELVGPSHSQRTSKPPSPGETAPDAFELGELVTRFADHAGFRPDDVRRHVMWLLKYGLAEVIN